MINDHRGFSISLKIISLRSCPLRDVSAITPNWYFLKATYLYVDHFSMHNSVVMLSKPNSGILRVLYTSLISKGESLIYFWTEINVSHLVFYFKEDFLSGWKLLHIRRISVWYATRLKTVPTSSFCLRPLYSIWHIFHMQVILKCLMTYKKKHLVQYHENFERLLNDATFRTELTMFGIDSENTIVKEEDRSTVMPILLRILYGQLNLMSVCLFQTRVMIVWCVYWILL